MAPEAERPVGTKRSKLVQVARRSALLLVAGFLGLHLFPAGWDFLYAADADRVALVGTVRQAEGAVPVGIGKECSLLVDPNFKAGFNCRVELDCGGTPLWGGRLRGGYATCETRAGRFARGSNLGVTDWGGSVSLVFDLERKRLSWWTLVGHLEISW